MSSARGSGLIGMAKTLTFRARLQLDGKTATGIVVAEEIVEQLGRGRRAAVDVTIGKHTYPSTFGVRAGQVKLPVSAENRKLAGIEAGDVVEVRLTARG
jgi:hypothetical protein